MGSVSETTLCGSAPPKIQPCPKGVKTAKATGSCRASPSAQLQLPGEGAGAALEPAPRREGKQTPHGSHRPAWCFCLSEGSSVTFSDGSVTLSDGSASHRREHHTDLSAAALLSRGRTRGSTTELVPASLTHPTSPARACVLPDSDLLIPVGLYSSHKPPPSPRCCHGSALLRSPQQPCHRHTALTRLKQSRKKPSCSWHLSVRGAAREREERDSSVGTSRARGRNLACWELAVSLRIWTSSSHFAPELPKSFRAHSGPTRAKVTLGRSRRCLTPTGQAGCPQAPLHAALPLL